MWIFKHGVEKKAYSDGNTASISNVVLNAVELQDKLVEAQSGTKNLLETCRDNLATFTTSIQDINNAIRKKKETTDKSIHCIQDHSSG